MARFDLPPPVQNEKGLLSYVNTAFMRVRETFRSVRDTSSGSLEVTGGAQIDTGLAIVHNAVAVLSEPPVAGGCFVTVTPVGTEFPRDILVEVFSNTFAVSVIPVSVTWFAVGEN